MTFSNSQRRKIEKNKKILPPLSEGPFGSFPASSAPGKGIVQVLSPALIDRNHSKGIIQKRSDGPQTQVFSKIILSSHTGIGGMTASTFAGHKAGEFWLQDGQFGTSNGPSRTGVYCKQIIPPTEFRRHYERGDLPLCIQHATQRTLRWKVDVGMLDYHYYLPIFMDGLRELEEPYSFVALQGTIDLLDNGGEKVLPTIPQLIVPLKICLNTRHPEILVKVMKVLQRLLVCGEYIGQALVPYYRQLLPVFNVFKNSGRSMSVHTELQHKRHDLFCLIDETLNMLETYGGEDAFINIKYLIPTYESCM